MSLEILVYILIASSILSWVVLLSVCANLPTNFMLKFSNLTKNTQDIDKEISTIRDVIGDIHNRLDDLEESNKYVVEVFNKIKEIM